MLIALGAIVFVAISLGLARYLTAENRERDAVYSLLRDQARGDAQAMLERLSACDARCRANVAYDARRLKDFPKDFAEQSKDRFQRWTDQGYKRP